jgi:hypothetical protein
LTFTLSDLRVAEEEEEIFGSFWDKKGIIGEDWGLGALFDADISTMAGELFFLFWAVDFFDFSEEVGFWEFRVESLIFFLFLEEEGVIHSVYLLKSEFSEVVEVENSEKLDGWAEFEKFRTFGSELVDREFS